MLFRSERKPWGIFDPEAIKAVEKCGLKLHFYKAKISSIDSEWQEKYALTEISSDGAYTYFVITTDAEDYSFPLKELPAPDVNYTVKEAELKSLKASIRQHDDRLAVLKSYESDIQDDLNRTLSALDLHLANVSGLRERYMKHLNRRRLKGYGIGLISYLPQSMGVGSIWRK